METIIPIMTPIVREIQAGSLLKIFWFVLDFMIIAFANPKGAGTARKSEFLNKGVRFSVRARFNFLVGLPYGLMVVV